MKRAGLKIFILMVILVVATQATRHESAAMQESENAKIIRILTNPNLWQKDFPTVIKSINSFDAIGEIKVEVFQNDVVGSRKFEPQDAGLLRETSELRSYMAVNPRLKQQVVVAINSNWNQLQETVTPAGQAALSDGSLRVSLASKTVVEAQFLAPGLTLNTLREQNGEPESISREVADSSDDERRPLILTLYRYADGAITFATTDTSPNPELIDRAILDTKKISVAISTRPLEQKDLRELRRNQ